MIKRWQLRLFVKESSEKIARFLAWHCVPYPVRMWIVVRAFAEAGACDEYKNKHPDELGYSAVMRHFK